MINCHAQTNIKINTVNPVTIDFSETSKESDEAMYNACKGWQLTKEQVKQFFELSENYAEYPYSSYYQIPCKITGTLQSQGKTWNFTIDGGATGSWQQGSTTKYYGCNQAGCEPLVIMPTDNMNPEE